MNKPNCSNPPEQPQLDYLTWASQSALLSSMSLKIALAH
jgi:hypothetical protein